MGLVTPIKRFGRGFAYWAAGDLLGVAFGGTGASSASAGQVFAGPPSGSAAAPGFRALAVGDLPSGIGSTPINLALSATVASNALTVSVLGAGGAAPSASNPVYIPFKTASGSLAWLTITSALSLTVPSGATLGTVSVKAARVWVVVLNNGGSPLLGLQVCTDGATAIYPLGQSYQRTSVAIGSSSTTAGTLYAASAATGYVAVLGCIEATEATAGTWASAPSVVQRWMPGDKLPGDIVQKVTAVNGNANNVSGNSYTTNGTFQGVQGSISPTSAINPIDISASGGAISVPNNNVIGWVRLSRGSTGITLAESGAYGFANGSSVTGSWQSNIALRALDFPASTSALTYGTQLKSGDGSTNITYPNFGRVVLDLTEIMA